MVILLGGHVAFLISELVVELANNSQHFLPSVWHSFLMAKNVCVCSVCVSYSCILPMLISRLLLLNHLSTQTREP